ncbi:N-acetylglucosaminyl-phosphatidylinositol biosynthetic protein gpi1 [Bienertia sinuspersici]
MISPEGRHWVLKTVNLSWHGYKSKLKKMYLEAVEKGSNLDELHELVPEDELKYLISYWNTSPAKEQSKKNKRIREKLDDMHTMGPRTYAALRHNLLILRNKKQEVPNKQEPSKAKVYRESRTRNLNKTYKTSYGNTKDNMKMESQEGANDKDSYVEVKVADKSSFILAPEFVHSIQR